MSTGLEFTGERFTPECVREIWYEHWHRYVFARKFAAGKRVLDAACGEGYGSALLADVATTVVGVDLSETTVEHARSRYGNRSNLRFDVADAARLEVAKGTFDLVTSFETLEHLHEQDALLQTFANALCDDGMLIISSPDKHTYSDVSGHRNEFHVRELYRSELENLLARHFPYMRLYGQKLLFQSVMWALEPGTAGDVDVSTCESDASAIKDSLDYAPLYFIAVCSRAPISDDLTPSLSLFGDREESVYSHYNHEIRKNMAAGARIAELETELARLRTANVLTPSPTSRSVE